MASPADALRGTGDQEIERFADELQKDLASLGGLQERITEIRGRGESAQGRVVAEASASGVLTGLTIDPRAMRLGSDELAGAILQAAAGAVQNAGEQINELMGPFITDELMSSADFR
jgi:DNA-binding protein YbaB